VQCGPMCNVGPCAMWAHVLLCAGIVSQDAYGVATISRLFKL